VVVAILVFGIKSCLEAYRAGTWTAHETGGDERAAAAAAE
jgi:carbon starvation protein